MSLPEIWSATQGVTVSFTIQVRNANGDPLTNQYTGSEALTCLIWAGADTATAATITPTWISGPAGTVQVVLDGTTTASILAGLYEVSVQLADGSEMLWTGYLDLDAAPGTGTYRSLARLSDCQALMPDLFGGGHTLDAVPLLLDAATRAIESYCRRPLALTDFDLIYRPARTRKIQLKTWPVPVLTRLRTELSSVIRITCNSTTNQVATVQTTAVSQNSNVLASLIFTRIASGVSTSATLTASSYTTVSALVAAINALGGGWYAEAQSPYASWPASEINADPGTRGAFDGLELFAFTRDIGRYNFDPNTGIIELTENRPNGFRYPDYAYGYGYGTGYFGASDPRYAGVRVQYRAGYAIALADIAAGYTPVPSDLRTACVATAQAILEGVPASGPVQEQSVKDRSYKLRDDHSVIPASARVILGRYENARIF